MHLAYWKIYIGQLQVSFRGSRWLRRIFIHFDWFDLLVSYIWWILASSWRPINIRDTLLWWMTSKVLGFLQKLFFVIASIKTVPELRLEWVQESKICACNNPKEIPSKSCSGRTRLAVEIQFQEIKVRLSWKIPCWTEHEEQKFR
jgi:hypothetical protein